jgi:hypothetical protein
MKYVYMIFYSQTDNFTFGVNAPCWDENRELYAFEDKDYAEVYLQCEKEKISSIVGCNEKDLYIEEIMVL